MISNILSTADNQHMIKDGMLLSVASEKFNYMYTLWLGTKIPPTQNESISKAEMSEE
jgi:hypothetical protein